MSIDQSHHYPLPLSPSAAQTRRPLNRILSLKLPEMSHAVTEAMIESYALMILVMLTFFVYFCGMVWAFCNPKLSGLEEEDTPECMDDAVEQCVPSIELLRTRDWTEAHTPDFTCAHTCGSPMYLDHSSHSCYINSSYDVD